MKLTTWNVNGIRSLKRNISCILQDFDSDVVCFQETKVSRGQLPEDTALIDGYTSYFSYPRKQSGYSGVATYCKDQFTPENAEEELTVGDICLDTVEELDCVTNIDFEGRVMITHHLIKDGEDIRRLVVINVYCPRVDPEKPERHLYKIQFCNLLQGKMMELCLQGCSVVIVGDLNIACTVIDHCDPGDEKEFNSSAARRWLKSFFSTEIEINGSNIKAVDAFRYFYPDRKEAYTCWNTKTGARLTNYGTRIDYIIVSSDLIPLLSSCEILSDYQGSDHCPVAALLKCDPVLEYKVQLPPICTRLWPEFTGQQQKLNSFFQKVPNSGDNVLKDNKKQISQTSSKQKCATKKNTQKAITSFFKNNSTPVPYSCRTRDASKNGNFVDSIDVLETAVGIKDASTTPDISTTGENSSLEFDANLSVGNSSENEDFLTNSRTKEKSDEWKQLFRGPPKPPLCSKHKKPFVLRTVKKSGPNMGRQFYMCAQPAGALSNPEANCNFFKWVTAPKINSLKPS